MIWAIMEYQCQPWMGRGIPSEHNIVATLAHTGMQLELVYPPVAQTLHSVPAFGTYRRCRQYDKTRSLSC
jgi:hypothetical protein